ncbi:hypothetical protein IHE44_0005621 [Lamprotornis superbus]|uniref:Integrator complex subunit 4 n=1 Tax=Lamprotornis superbus TaxID=245042 RepID=A0A835NIR6_9PASS|nr:hypothetical protein IHE44_0005621 [Lamprotornis superbus]
MGQQHEDLSTKKLRLTKPSKSAALHVDLCKATSPADALQYLLQFARKPVEVESVEGVVRILLEHYYKENDASVRLKIASLLGLLSKTAGFSPDCIMDDAINTLQNEMEKGVAKEAESQAAKDVQKIIGDHFNDQDPRVRTAAIKAMLQLHERGLKLQQAIYSQACKLLADDYEQVRSAAVQLIWVLSQLYPESIVPIPSSNEEIRLVDDAFGKICHMVSDGSWVVRVQAAKLLGSMQQVSSHFLEQTLDKKLMSDLRRKRTAHERAKELYSSGEFSSGRKWGDDAPKEEIDTGAVNLIESGACGAFVHGLEDEMYEVRIAAVEALCMLAQSSPSFAEKCLDFLVDMFNDEIEEVRLQSIHTMRKISNNITLREDQLDTVLAVLEDSSRDIREALHELLCCTNVSTKEGIHLALVELLKNLTKYPTDRESIWNITPNEDPSQQFLHQSLERVYNFQHLDPRGIQELLEFTIRDLQRLGELQSELAGMADFTATYLQCQLLLIKALQEKLWNVAAPLYLKQNALASAAAKQILEETYKMEFMYSGVESRQVVIIHHMRLQAKALQLIVTARTTRGCFISELPHMQGSFVDKLLDLMPRLVSSKPSEVVKILQTTLRQSTFLHLPLPEQLHRATANIIEPTGESDNPLRFTSGLVVALDVDATLEHVQDPQGTVKVQVLYPDGQAQLIHPKPADFRNPGPGRHRLITQVYLSHTAWTEPCQIEVRLLLAYNSNRSKASTRIPKSTWNESLEAFPPSENSIEGTIPFSKPVKVYIMPKPARRLSVHKCLGA